MGIPTKRASTIIINGHTTTHANVTLSGIGTPKRSGGGSKITEPTSEPRPSTTHRAIHHQPNEPTYSAAECTLNLSMAMSLLSLKDLLHLE
jgi:hypothetical protein